MITFLVLAHKVDATQSFRYVCPLSHFALFLQIRL